MASRRISEKTLKSLYAHSGNKCAFRGCGKTLLENEDKNYSNILYDLYGSI